MTIDLVLYTNLPDVLSSATVFRGSVETKGFDPNLQCTQILRKVVTLETILQQRRFLLSWDFQKFS